MFFIKNVGLKKSASSIFVGVAISLMPVLFGLNTAQAWVFYWEAGSFLEYSDNIARTSSNEDEGVVLEPRGAIIATHEGSRLSAEIAAYNEYRSHSDGVIGSSNNFDLDGVLDWRILPGLLEWTLEDHFNSEFPIDVRDSPNERNTQDVNVLATGPTFTPRIFNLTNMIFEGRYIRTDAEESDIDSDRLQGRAGIERQLNPSSSISLIYQYEDTDFDENTIDPLVGNIDFDRDDYYIEYLLEKPSLNITAQLGYTEIERDEGPNRSSDGNNSELTVEYILNSTSSLELNAYDQFTDTTENSLNGNGGLGGFGSSGGGGSTGVPVGTTIGDLQTDVTGDTVDSEGFLIGFNKRFSRLETMLQYFQRDDDHDLVNINDRDSNGGVIEFTLPVTGTTYLGLLGEYRTTDYDIGGREDDDTLVELTGEYLARRNLSFESSVEYRDRDSTIAGEDFDEFLVRVGFTYSNF